MRERGRWKEIQKKSKKKDDVPAMIGAEADVPSANVFTPSYTRGI